MIVKDLVDWVLKNRCGKAFDGFSDIQIATVIVEAMECKCFGVIFDANREVAGVCTGEVNHKARTVRISHLLCTFPGVVPKLLTFYRQHFTGYRMIARRRGKEREYDTERFLKKLARL